MSKKFNIKIYVNNNQLERALKQLKKKMEREGVSRDMKRIVYYEAPTQQRRKSLMRAVKQNAIRLLSQRP